MNPAIDKTTNNLLQDRNRASIQTENGILTTNGSQVSPLTVGTSIVPLLIPTDATSIVLAPTTDLLISEDPAMASTYLIPAGAAEVFPTGKTDTLYIKSVAAGNAVNFRFHII